MARNGRLGARTQKEATVASFAPLELRSSSPEIKEGHLSSTPLIVTEMSSDGGGKEEGVVDKREKKRKESKERKIR